MLQELGKQNPQLLGLIQENHAEFLQLINEPVDASEGWVTLSDSGDYKKELSFCELANLCSVFQNGFCLFQLINNFFLSVLWQLYHVDCRGGEWVGWQVGFLVKRGLGWNGFISLEVKKGGG